MTLEQADLIPDLADYDRVVVALSGGKDSVAATLALLEAGLDPARLIFFHHRVDGAEGSTLMDWPSTEAYCEAFARHVGAPMWWSWREGGFEAEMLRDDTPTGAVLYEIDGVVTRLPGAANAPRGVRKAFPQVAVDLSVRWCSAALKIDVADRVLRNHPLFEASRTLFLTGERGEESPNRARYAFFEPHRVDRRAGRKGRLVDHLRPVLRWSEAQVWEALRRHGVDPHPAYKAGFGRLSCRNCIFAGEDQWATLAACDPDGFAAIAAYETAFGRTIHRKLDVRTRATRGAAYPDSEIWAPVAMSARLNTPIHVDPARWVMPAGAFSGHGGPS